MATAPKSNIQMAIEDAIDDDTAVLVRQDFSEPADWPGVPVGRPLVFEQSAGIGMNAIFISARRVGVFFIARVPSDPPRSGRGVSRRTGRRHRAERPSGRTICTLPRSHACLR